MFFLLVAMTAMTPPPETQYLCGRTYATMTQLSQELRVDKDVAHFPEKDSVVTFYDRKAMTLWWLTKRRGRVSIATCKHKIATDNGYTDGRVEADCNGDRTGLCAAQAQRMAAAKF